MTHQRAEEARLRGERADLLTWLSAIPQSEDANRRAVSRLIQENTSTCRQLIVDRAMDPCTQPDCVLEGTVSVDAKQWCPFHGGQRRDSS